MLRKTIPRHGKKFWLSSFGVSSFKTTNYTFSTADHDIREEVDTFMFEGHDTTACALSWTLLLLANHPHAQEKILAEQREIFGDVEDFATADVEQSQLAKMKYLEACVKEVRRNGL